MCEPAPTPLPRLSEECARCLRDEKIRQQKQGAHLLTPCHRQPTGEANCQPCRELAMRALYDGNDAAWDLLLLHLWPCILRWLYVAQPELTPARAKALGYRALVDFRHYYTQRPGLATELTANFPTFPVLLLTLRHFLRRAAEEGGG